MDLVIETSGMIAFGFWRIRESVFWQRGADTVDAPRCLEVNEACDFARVILLKDYYIMARTAFATFLCMPINDQDSMS